ncbi:DNA-3-methyladenine glycosylase I [Levilactobacillus bambusae]|uniref:DNA-3-methyladenine glycosylase I n=1 Tax=Levilactobacillus bambusae TaxID=2024736 RepID=A0A2V1MYQ7_9LACO|nr:DNA-3-methyladenine glycosylase I [Levilactobacillus bambusae]PWG00144.1 DNA-3-methyladenine glycosylase I [Levilactobacillus bambusae]
MIGPNDGNDFSSQGVADYDRYFGTPTYDDHVLFELLTVGVFQVGLSWQAAASKLPVLRRDFKGMAIEAVAQMGEPDVERIAADPDMIRNPRKIAATITNAQAILTLKSEFSHFSDYLWQFVDEVPLTMQVVDRTEVENQWPLGALVAKDMKRRGFKFVGPVVTTMFLKAAGIFKDEVLD